MSFYSRLRNLLGLETKAGLTDPEPWLFDLFGATTTAAGITVSPRSAMSCAPVHRCVRLIAETMGQLPVEVYKRGPDGERVRVPNHPVEVLLSTSVNDFTPASKFIEDVVQDAALYPVGGFAHIGRAGDGSVIELLRLDPEQTSVILEFVNWQPEYVYRQVAGANGSVGTQRVAPRNLIHIPSPSINGQGMVRQLKDVIALAIILEQHAARLFGNSAKPSGVLSVKRTGTAAPAIDNIRAIWNAAHGGGKSGSTAVLPDDVTWQQLTLNSTDAQFHEMRRFSVAEISRGYGVPLHMLSELDRATFRNAEQQAAEFLSTCIGPWARRVAGELSLKLFTTEERADGFHIVFDTDEIVRTDLLARMQALGVAVANRILSPNEARQIGFDMEPYEGGDEHVNPHTTSPHAPGPQPISGNGEIAE